MNTNKKPISYLSSALANIRLNQQQQPTISSNALTPPPVVDRIAQYRENLPTEGISLFSHRSAPNGFKIAVILSELNIKYKTFYLDFAKNEQRSPYYIEINPNARVPTIIDHDNNDHTVWESGAIVIYLCQRSGIDSPLWSEDFTEQSIINSWLFYQASGHAPMIGQALHFRYFHSEVIPSAIERYTHEVRRVYAVIEMRLAENREAMFAERAISTVENTLIGCSMSSIRDENDIDQSIGDGNRDYFDTPVWLFGGRITVADLTFVIWNHVVDRIGISLENEFPEVYRWTKHMLERPRVSRALAGLESG
jgi:glutathione S-transferase